MHSWVPVDHDSDFALQNLPYGIFSTSSHQPRCGVAIGAFVLDMQLLAAHDVFEDLSFDHNVFKDRTLNRYAALGLDVQRQVRQRLQDILRADTAKGHVLRDNNALREKALVPMSEVEMHLPMFIGDYTDFYTSPHHAKNCTQIFGLGDAPKPSFFKMPLAYGGRASSVVISGTPFRRPNGQFMVDKEPHFGPCQKLDYEVEFSAFIGRGNEHGEPIDVDNAEDHIFGVVLMNDWSARDIQGFELDPLGPFNGKNFATTISPWVVPLDALKPYRTKPISPGPLAPYLDEGDKPSTFDIPIEAQIEVDGTKYLTATCNTGNTCFSFAQMIAHHTAGGCPLKPGDLIGTGTLSGGSLAELGCLLEANLGGKRKCHYGAKEDETKSIDRDWLQDGDKVHFTARRKCEDGPGFVGFGSCSGQVLASPSREGS
ncbi:fumarylacetoacetate (FAA) hydrolase family protein [Sarocladium implicatum]|nr:fumarylacetoacetate (FAA) hydrolase family protein [Sarocladium implicatum]